MRAVLNEEAVKPNAGQCDERTSGEVEEERRIGIAMLWMEYWM